MALRCRGGVDGLNAVALTNTSTARNKRERANIVGIF
jgi:hypothetical protein